MYGRRQSLLFSPALSFLSLLYRAAIVLRQALYQRRILKGKKLPCKVISIGNITLGGTGKTPMVIAVAAALLWGKRRRPAVISRGYGRLDESETLLVSDGRSVLVDTQSGGDEAVLIGSTLSGVPVVWQQAV
jgi:tetraacyldisaccharide 4'-kinase